MKKISIIKDVIISILIVACILLILSIIFYNKIPLNKVVPESEEYAIDEQMQEDLEASYENENAEVVTTYYIDAADLKKYERNNEYKKGKKNPFAAESVTAGNSTTSGGSSGSSSGDSSSTETGTKDDRFYPDDGTK